MALKEARMNNRLGEEPHAVTDIGAGDDELEPAGAAREEDMLRAIGCALRCETAAQNVRLKYRL